MPGHPTQVLKPGKVSADNKRNDNHQKKQTLLKRIRVIYTDPDLTDSSSDDEQGAQKYKHYTSNGEKRCVKEVGVFGSVPNIKKSCKVTSQNGTRLKSKYVGVRQRISGKWAAEIKDHYHHVRLWLGTYNTEEEAHSAYENKRLEIQSLMEQKKMNSKDVHCFRSVAMSPASVLEASNTASNVSDRSSNANAGCSKKDVDEDKSGVNAEIKPADVNDHDQIKGLKMVFDDFKEEDFLMCTLGNLADGPNSSSCLLDLDLEDYTWLDEILKLCGLGV